MAIRYYGDIKFRPEKGSLPKRWVINAEPHVKIRLKRIFKQIETYGKSLVITHNIQNCKDLQWAMVRYPLKISDADTQKLEKACEEYDENQRRSEEIRLPDFKPRQGDLAKPLRQYQGVPVELLRINKGLLCGDDLGLGKTVEAIAAMCNLEHAIPAAVVCQTHLTAQWEEQIKEFAPHLRTHIVKKRSPYNLPEADVYIFTYSKIIGWDDLLQKEFFNSCYFDECQELRKTASQKYLSCKIVSRGSNYSMGLSATPVYNYGEEIHSIMDLLKEDSLGSRSEFLKEWCDGDYAEGKARVSDPEALGYFLRENNLMVRRARADVSRELPAINKMVYQIDYDHGYAEKKEKELQDIAARVLEGSFTERGQAARMLDIHARMMTGVAKSRSVSDYVRLIMESEPKIVLVGWHREVYEQWMQDLKQYNPVMYTGSESPSQKAKSVEAFKSGDSRIFVMSLRSGVGLDGLQSVCNTVVFGELDWSPGVHDQVVGRLHRDGQSDQVNAIYLVTNSGTDPLMVDMLGLKASQASGIVNLGKQTFNQTNEDRIKALAKKYAKG